ncbi:MAG: sigma-54 dependent transcriptional regulator [Phycisphaerae bacterium]|nr:MAG: sigma-54-dependent Fis family transcriptional regulator [Planctomycetota bacterium]KAB2946004.1 MAG: sigma-54-dependent Fis family transcriptional regulator [Phycisphaerae bacterium]MBE7456227.1 sigma-54-dependent Fis family transcriptional regulator [Planctomycetia bacterium]MCK6464776.1 sigma-54 dependent transcriptional regulator [Phycisphaerae bacterium]MCL4719882.1 sigma-54 dependent transcriptional regulator [Phycisphaerae bacterium]
MNVRILIIEDEQLIRWSLRQKFESLGYQVTEAQSGTEALEALNGGVYDLIMLDYRLPDMTGLDVLSHVREHDSDVVVIMMTAFSTIESAVDAMKLGAYDYITKPFDMDQLLRTVQKALETTKLRREVRHYREHIENEYDVSRIVGEHACMKELFDIIRRVAESNASTVFLRGESGTGKDLVARVIHYNSDRAPRPFMNITCTALSETLLESELFGHERGAFTDAKAQKKGLFEMADGGTIFLDEVGDMPPGLQAKLLRFLEERRFRRVGGTTEISVDVRVIAATNRDIEKAIADGQFREDLFYRLNVISILLPPLRERGDDIRILAQHLTARFAREFRKNIHQIDETAFRKLCGYAWPGNVRELRNVIERAVLLARGDTLTGDDIVVGGGGRPSSSTSRTTFSLPPEGINLKMLEGELIRQAMERSGNNQTQAARLLGLRRDAFRYRLEKFGMLK